MNTLKEGDYSLQVCDQCHNKRIKCDREIPQCQQCQDKGLSCTYLRVLKQTKQLYSNRVAILPLGRLPNQPTRKRRSKKELLALKTKNESSDGNNIIINAKSNTKSDKNNKSNKNSLSVITNR
ncbi:hypothetical protein K502DRAFT_32969 [Neoconidiobolus thromboides FSU 785]|nr:hypothetical protein K502DRAFT_32969 [Neoconidiobolus thromboides FSU 785]